MLIATYQILWYLAIVAELFLLGRVIACRLALRYPAFTAWLVIDLAGTVALIPFAYSGNAYRLVYAATSMIGAFASIVFAVETFNRHHSHYRTRRYGAILLASFSAVAVCASAVLFIWEGRTPDYGWQRFAIMAARAVSSAVGVFLLVGAWIFRRVSVDVRLNVLAIERIAGVYFTALGLLLFGVNLSGGTAGMLMNFAIEAMSAILFAVWALSLSRAGEIVPQMFTGDAAATLAAEAPESIALLKSFKWSPTRGLRGKD